MRPGEGYAGDEFNPADHLYAIRALVDSGAIGALSTHDVSLTEIAGTSGLHGANVHMGARKGGDPLDFDYELKPGVTVEANALAIARMAGIPV